MTLISNHSGLFPEAGTDEAGRGCLAGPVVAAAVILPPDFRHPFLNDSKQVSKKHRDILRPIIENNAISWQVALCSPEEIDKLNILNASILAMHRALEGLKETPKHILVDGNRFKPYKNIPYSTMVKGDSRFVSIAAASILAKTHRDALMEKLHIEHPAYGWDKNAGYPTEKHREAIAAFGSTPHHRKTFTLLKSQITLFP
ncbi:MAG: ribonuclease HII [Bacteroidetes bacterium]|jgi:ribonuclease HII|nr:ribonuclease HII [Bacteroidota bacterium]